MANTINTNLGMYYKSTFEMSKRTSVSAKDGIKTESSSMSLTYEKSVSVELSGEGLAALAESQTPPVADNVTDEENKNSGEPKLSAKAQEFLKNLGEKYGDYDFFVADKIDDSTDYSQMGTKKYSVIFTADEIERMAEDEEYADKVMGKVDSAVDMTKRLEERGDLGEGVSFKRIAISFDDDGNMKLFAELEKMSAKQQERLEEAREKRAEEKKEAEKDEKEKETSESEDSGETGALGAIVVAKKDDEEGAFSLKRFSVEATSEDELLEKILGINWDEVSAVE